MRNLVSVLPFLALVACGGAGPQSVGSNAVPGGATGGGGTGGTTTTHTFVNPTVQKTYSAIGGVQSYSYYTDDRDRDPNTPQFDPSGQRGQLYAGDSSTARNSGITVDYNPRDGIFEVKIAASQAGVNETLRFQDPAHRTDFGGAKQPQVGTPQLAAGGIQYLQAGSSSKVTYDPQQSLMVPVGDKGGDTNVLTFFYQKPGTETKYVTFAGFVRNATTVTEMKEGENGPTYLQQNVSLERAAFTYGERTDNNAVPKTGTATFNGPMIATMVYNPNIDTDARSPTYFQWIEGRSKTVVDFAAASFTLDLNGTVFAPQFDVFTSRSAALNQGASFAASGKGRVDLVGAGGFLGQFDTASFTQGGVTSTLTLAGSTIDGAFFGPAADEVGGGFRIVGGTPDQRIDIIGAFTGGK
jgi:hypothetical protein